MSKSKDQYNGWKNKETWIVNLWVSNNYETYCMINEAMGDYIKEAFLDSLNFHNKYMFILRTMEDHIERDIKEEIQDQLESTRDGSFVLFDLVNHSLSRVDWNRLAECCVHSFISHNITPKDMKDIQEEGDSNIVKGDERAFPTDFNKLALDLIHKRYDSKNYEIVFSAEI
jgi:hypothetical protein